MIITGSWWIHTLPYRIWCDTNSFYRRRGGFPLQTVLNAIWSFTNPSNAKPTLFSCRVCMLQSFGRCSGGHYDNWWYNISWGWTCSGNRGGNNMSVGRNTKCNVINRTLFVNVWWDMKIFPYLINELLGYYETYLLYATSAKSDSSCLILVETSLEL